MDVFLVYRVMTLAASYCPGQKCETSAQCISGTASLKLTTAQQHGPILLVSETQNNDLNINYHLRNQSAFPALNSSTSNSENRSLRIEHRSISKPKRFDELKKFIEVDVFFQTLLTFAIVTYNYKFRSQECKTSRSIGKLAIFDSITAKKQYFSVKISKFPKLLQYY